MKSNQSLLTIVDYFHNANIELFHTYAYGLLGFFLPLLLSHPQLLVGSVVNMTLFLAAQHLRGKKIVLLLITPSIGAVFHGILFGPLTMYLVYFLPFIWLGNGLLVFGYKWLRQKQWPKLASGILAIVFKVLLLAIVAFLFVSLAIVPQPFLYAMSIVQLLTAFIGMIGAFGVSFTLSSFP